MICSLTRQIVILLPAAYLLSLSGSVGRVWLAFPITGVVSLAVSLLLWKDVYKRNIAPLSDSSWQEVSHRECENLT